MSIFNDWYELWKQHAIESLWLFDIIPIIQSKNFTCDQLHALICAIDDIKWSDYEDKMADHDPGHDRYDQHRDNQL